jgi:hypothetical protein
MPQMRSNIEKFSDVARQFALSGSTKDLVANDLQVRKPDDGLEVGNHRPLMKQLEDCLFIMSERLDQGF